jgi:hypothetical protein
VDVDLPDIVGVLPENSVVRRLIEFCVRDLGLKPYEITYALERAHDIARGIDVLGHEGRLARGEYKKASEERIAARAAEMAPIIALAKKAGITLL